MWMASVAGNPVRVVDTPDMGIVMPDGCRLSARVWMPEDAGTHPVPAVLEYIPYRKRDGTLPRDEIMHPYVAARGYACVRVDMRGCGDSEGLLTDEYTEQELQDACDVIAWLAAQPWCTGAVGMMGKSWGGFNCLQTAFLQPPALKAVISVCSTTDRFADDIHFRGGCLLGENLGWGAVMLSYSSRPADPLLRNDWHADWLRRLEAEPFLSAIWARHQTRDAYWKHGSICEDYSRVQVPVLSIGGWADNYMNTCAALVENVNAKAIVGPWVHQYPHTAVPGPAIGFLQEAERWWDRWLKGIDNGADRDPAMRAYVLDSEPPNASPRHRAGTWVADTWPPAQGSSLTLALSPGRRLGGAGGTLDTPVNTPQHLGMSTGEFFPMGLNAEMPGDQAADDALSVCFDGAPLDAPLQLLGRARLRATVSSDEPLAFLALRLNDVAPDGSSVRIAHGMLNLCHRDSAEHPQPMTPGEPVQVDIGLDLMGYRLAPGHRLRLAVSTTYWPFVWPSPRAATVTLHEGELLLPLHKGGQPWQPPPPEGATPWAHRVLKPAKATRRIERDLIAGTESLIVEDDQGEVENLTHGLITAETMAERWTIRPDDPLSAEVTIRWTQSLRRGNWSVRTEAEARMTGTESDLRMQAQLTAWEGDAQVFTRSWDETVARSFV